MSIAELLAIVINQGNKEKNALTLAHELLNKCNHNLIQFSELTLRDLMEIKGIGRGKAAIILACMEIAKRFMVSSKLPNDKITDPQLAVAFAKANIQFYPYEVFHVIFLNNANKIISFEILSEGSITSTIADPRLIFKRALELNAIKMILCHNHPSGVANPSDADIQLTKKFIEASKLLDLQIIDHLIITTDSYYSFAENGYI